MSRPRIIALAVALVASAAVAAGCGSAAKVSGSSAGSGSGGSKSDSTLNGAGATFPEPLYAQWSGDFHAANSSVSVNYQGVGSGAGIEQFTKKTVDFGATDAPMKDAEIAAAKAAGGEVLHIPTALGAVVVTYNVPGVTKLRLDGPTLAEIYLGKITDWSDSKIAALNPGAKLPKLAIATVHRGDKSGTTYVFTGYLSAVSPAWSKKPGQDKEIVWPGGVGAQGNDGVAAAVKQQKGAIGYNEIAYALQNKIPFASLKNKNGEFVDASLESTTAAAKGFAYPADLRFSLLDSASSGAYPIVSATWQLVWLDPAKAGLSHAKARNLVAWLNWELGAGQAQSQALDYARAVTKWSYEDLQNAVEVALKQSDFTLWSLVEAETDLDESQFVDAVQRRLTSGRLMLLGSTLLFS